MKKSLTATILVSIGVFIGWQAATWSHSQAMAQAMAQAVARSAAQNSGESKAPTAEGYILERDAEVAKTGPAPHSGPGRSTGYSFFEKAAGFKQVFRKRVLHPGAAIGYHLQKEDEVYYILSGEGVMQMNGKEFPVKPGDAILTRPGSSHGLKQTGKDDLTLIIVYER
jgi:mannose-6-phosphate isomerase-like protein (cupin superfamily)